jgi:hypothetical protein
MVLRQGRQIVVGIVLMVFSTNPIAVKSLYNLLDRVSFISLIHLRVILFPRTPCIYY